MSHGFEPSSRRAQRAAARWGPAAAAGVAGILLMSQALAGAPRARWGAPINMGAPINTEFNETGAKLTRQGRTLYFASDRPCGADDQVLDFNLWVAHRPHRNASWQEPKCLAINADSRLEGEPAWSDREPELSDDGHWLFFASDRPGSLGGPIPAGGDIWVSWRHDVRDDDGWTEPFPVPGLNTEAGERGPQYFERHRGHYGHHGKRGAPQLFFSTTRSGFIDLWVVNILHGNLWGAPEPIDEVNTADLVDAGGVLSPDGREMYLFRGDPRPQVGIDLDLYVAIRPHIGAPWSAPVDLGAPINSPANDQEPTLSDDGELLLFASNRDGSMMSPFGRSLDLWVSKRRAAGAHRHEHGHRPSHGASKPRWPNERGSHANRDWHRPHGPHANRAASAHHRGPRARSDSR